MTRHLRENVSGPEREAVFLRHISNLINIAETNGAQIAIVGGIALKAHLNKPVEFMRKNGSTPDLDAIGLGPDKKTLSTTIEMMQRYNRKNPDSPAIGLENVIFSDNPSRKSPFVFLSGLRNNSDGDFFLTFRDIETRIYPDTMKIINVPYGKIMIPTLPLNTIYWRYFVRSGIVKPKDINKLEEMFEYIQKTGQMDELNYRSYEEFRNLILERYWIPLLLVRFYWWLDIKTNGRMSATDLSTRILRK